MSGVVKGRAVRKWSIFNQLHYWALEVVGNQHLTGCCLSPSDAEHEKNIRESVASINARRKELGLPLVELFNY